MSVRLDGIANDGASGEGDNHINVENVFGGAGGDNLSSFGANFITALVGGVGDDFLVGGNGVLDNLVGGGNDTIRGNSGANRLAGGRGNDNLNSVDGVSGNDRLEGSDGFDICTADPVDLRIECEA